MTDKVVQLSVAGAVGSSPWWSDWINIVHQGASTIAVVAGAIIGVFTVIKMYKAWRKDK